MATTYTPIASTTLGSATASITLSSIPSTYTDLKLVMVGAGGGGDLVVRFNSDSASTYSYTGLYCDTTTVYSSRATGTSGYIDFNAFSGVLGSDPNITIIDIFSYSKSIYKSMLSTTNTYPYGNVSYVSLYQNTAAISSITMFTNNSVNLSAGFMATLYGIKKA